MAKKTPLKFTSNLPVDLIFGDGFQRRGKTHPRIREEYVDAAELFADLLDDAFKRGGLAHVAAQYGNAVPELTCDRLQPVRILPDDYNGRTFFSEQLRSFKSDAGSSAGNEDDFVRQFHDLLLVRKFLVRSRVLKCSCRRPRARSCRAVRARSRRPARPRSPSSGTRRRSCLSS